MCVDSRTIGTRFILFIYHTLLRKEQIQVIYIRLPNIRRTTFLYKNIQYLFVYME